MGFLISKADRGSAPDAKPGKGGRNRSDEPEVVTHKPSSEGEYWLSRTPGLLRAITGK